MRKHENVLVFYKNLVTYNPQMTVGNPYKGFHSDEKKIGEVYGDMKSIHKENSGTDIQHQLLNLVENLDYIQLRNHWV